MERISDKLSIGEKFGDKKMLNKKPPTNKKYKDVKKVLDTGKTINDVQVLSDKYVSKRKNELFRRIKGSTIIKLLEENNNTESIYNLAEEGKDESVYGQGGNNPGYEVMTNANKSQIDNESVYSYKTSNTQMTNKTTVTAVTYATEMLGNLSQLSFILLDLREKSDYNDFHIKEAISYPAPNISRDKFTTEMLNLKNKPDKLIIIYGSDERNSIPPASLLIQKGFDNIFLLSGGIEEFVKEYPEKCEGPLVQQFINEKMQQEILKKDGILIYIYIDINFSTYFVALLKSTTKSKMGSGTKSSFTGTKDIKGMKDTRSISVDVSKPVSSKTSVVSGVSNKNSISNLKKNLQK